METVEANKKLIEGMIRIVKCTDQESTFYPLEVQDAIKKKAPDAYDAQASYVIKILNAGREEELHEMLTTIIEKMREEDKKRCGYMTRLYIRHLRKILELRIWMRDHKTEDEGAEEALQIEYPIQYPKEDIESNIFTKPTYEYIRDIFNDESLDETASIISYHTYEVYGPDKITKDLEELYGPGVTVTVIGTNDTSEWSDIKIRDAWNGHKLWNITEIPPTVVIRREKQKKKKEEDEKT